MTNFTLEHRKQKLLPWPKFILRLSTYLAFSLGVIAFSLLLGILGYHSVGKLSFLNSFYMSCMILTGMGPVTDMPSAGAKIFSSLYALYSGIVFLSITAVFFTPIIHRILHILHMESDNDDNKQK
jgi:hypothetical protein